jgi:poly(3-hydroxybutyrate) depolymerase
MLYQSFQTCSDMLQAVQTAARFAGTVGAPWLRPGAGRGADGAGLKMAAWLDLLADSRITFERPPFGIEQVRCGDRDYDVVEEVVHATPFGSLLHFRKAGAPTQPRVLVAAPLSGHFATLLRNTVRTLLEHHDVFITDWHNARDVPVSEGVFGFDDYVEHLIRFHEVIGPGGHLLAVCQPCVPALAALAVMAADRNPAEPRSLTLMAGPIDTRVSPTKVNDFATKFPIEWFEASVIATVPMRYRGAFRRVYPGFLQLTAFMSMNVHRHVAAHVDLFESLAARNVVKAGEIRRFYDEYFAIMDLPAEFYLETVKRVFQDQDLARGRLTFRGDLVDPGAIRRAALLTIEGERDDICGIGQTVAAQDLCTFVRPYRRRHHVQIGAGHYGVFSGKRWEREIYPVVRSVIHTSE